MPPENLLRLDPEELRGSAGDGREVDRRDVGIFVGSVEQKPTFNGGDANDFSKWVNSRLVYPEIAKENGVEGRVTLQFTIDKEGRLGDVKVLSAPDKTLADEAVRVVSSSPKWTPGKQRDRTVKVSYTFPVIYRLR